jgi:hypothetical protein
MEEADGWTWFVKILSGWYASLFPGCIPISIMGSQ